LLESHLPALVYYEFTAKMEDDLDSISRGESTHVAYLKKFYFGNGAPGLKKQLANKVEEIDAREICSIPLGTPTAGPQQEPIVVRVGRYGPYIEQGARRASLLEDSPPDELTLDGALEMLDRAAQAEEPLGICPDTPKPVFMRIGRFGPYVQRGLPDDEEKPKNASLLPGMKPEDVDLATALRLLTLPRTVGNHPESGEPVVAHNGRFGPYIKCGEETRSLPAGVSLLEITLDEALALLAAPKVGRGRSAAKREPIKTFDASPVTGKPVQLLEGRYGPYVADGETNASLPRDAKPEELTFQEALSLLADRAARGPSKKAARRGRAAPKAATAKAAPKKAVKKTAKKAAKKKSAKKPAKRGAKQDEADDIDSTEAAFVADE
jgi:DNA topoisomerase-1